MPAAWRACRCCEVFALDCPLARANSSTVRGAWASRSSSSSRRGLANALPISAIASNSASFARPESILRYSIEQLMTCQSWSPTKLETSPAFFRQLLNDETACASYLFGCKSNQKFAVVDPHVDLVDDYIELAEAQQIPIVA